MKKFLLYGFGIFVVLAVFGKFVEQPKPPTSDLPKRADEEPMDCSGKGYTSAFIPQTTSMPATVWVTFRGTQPRPAVAEAAVRSCMKHAQEKKSFQGNLMGFAWWSKSGKRDDDSTQQLTDGETSLVTLSGKTDILSWTEYIKTPEYQQSNTKKQ